MSVLHTVAHPAPARPAPCGGPRAGVPSRPVAASDPRDRTLPTLVGADLVVPTLTGPAAYANFDHAASTPALTDVAAAVERTLGTYASVHRGAGYASRVTSAWYEEARRDIADFVGAREDDLLVFTRTTTDSWNLLARALPTATRVVVFASEHHSTLLPWDDGLTRRLPVPRTREEAVALLDTALTELRSEGAAAPRDEILVVVTAASNVTGEVWPVDRLTDVAHRHGARIAVDAAQLSAHRRIDLAGWDADWVAFSGHKTYAPFGTGVLAGRRDWLDAATPHLIGGGATRAVREDGVEWATGAARHEGGSPNVVGAVALAAACTTLRRHRDLVEAHEADLTDRLRTGLAGISGITQLAIFDEPVERVGVVAFTVAGYDASLVSQVLAAEHGIGVRDGRFCAHLLVDGLLGRTVGDPAQRGTAVRASIGLGSTAEGVDRLLGALRELVAAGPSGTWEHARDGWRLVGADPRDVEVTRPW